MMTTDLDYWISTSSNLEDAKYFYNEIRYSNIKYFMFTPYDSKPNDNYNLTTKAVIVDIDRGITMDELISTVKTNLNKFSSLYSIKFIPSTLTYEYTDWWAVAPKPIAIVKKFSPSQIVFKGVTIETKE